VVAVGVWGWRAAQPPAMREVATRPGERLEIGLPDGSHVVLGAASRIRFTSGRFAHARTIDLDGEAYFTVAHDTQHPFVVRTHGAAVQAVGTAFDVRSYAEDSVVNVAVSEGRVVLRPRSGAIGTGTLLGRGDLGQMDADGRASVQHDANIDRYLAWVRGRLVYDMAPVTMIVRDLERWYDLTITIDDRTRTALGVTMTIDPTQPAPRALQRLAEVLNLHVVQQGRHVELTTGAPAAP
ncbi:MAG: FecR domain-containing protein, partial [Gemmatimonadaceae bacterium]|nr:FecR domain-containing protein [Gemmatimonadaceae bacterium]